MVEKDDVDVSAIEENVSTGRSVEHDTSGLEDVAAEQDLSVGRPAEGEEEDVSAVEVDDDDVPMDKEDERSVEQEVSDDASSQSSHVSRLQTILKKAEDEEIADPVANEAALGYTLT